MRVVVNALVVFIVVVPFVLVGAAVWLLVQRQRGEVVEAEVIGCELEHNYKSTAQYCMARWTEDGVEHTGPIQGSGDHEVGETIEATLRGDELYSRSLTLPVTLLVLGVPMLFIPFAFVRRRLRARAAPQP